jgi:serine/threonine-protein kinase
LLGTTLEGQYRVDAVVGEGGFGVVYKGWHVSFEQPIAIKVLKIPPLSLEAQNDILSKFRDEGRLLYTLSQASLNIVRSIGFGALTTPSGVWAPFIVLEWLEGRSLQADLDERTAKRLGGRPLAEVIKLLEPAARGLGVAHRKRVAHRDIKPANMFLTRTKDDPPQDTVKILDFGIAKVVEEGSNASGPGGTQSAFSSFTWLYCAPEQFDPRYGPTGPWTDVFAFTLVFSEVLTGKPPFAGTEAYAIMKEATDTARRPTPRARGAIVPDAVEAVCARALAVDPKARFADIDEMWNALTQAARGASMPDGQGGNRGGTAMLPAHSTAQMGATPARGNSTVAVPSTQAPSVQAPSAVAASRPPPAQPSGVVRTPPPGTVPPYQAGGPIAPIPTPPPMMAPTVTRPRQPLPTETHPVVWVVLVIVLVAVTTVGTCVCTIIHQ